jgi:hypothetical protein
MGFSDPDRRTPQHDRICERLATRADEFVKRYWSEPDKDIGHIRLRGFSVAYVKAFLETPLSGRGRIQNTIGFLDVYIWGRGRYAYRSTPGWKSDVGTSCCSGTVGPHSHIDLNWTVEKRFLIEVKTRFPGVGELLRQINFYKSADLTQLATSDGTDAQQWFVACPDPISKPNKQLLTDNGVTYVRVSS